MNNLEICKYIIDYLDLDLDKLFKDFSHEEIFLRLVCFGSSKSMYIEYNYTVQHISSDEVIKVLVKYLNIVPGSEYQLDINLYNRMRKINKL